MSFNNAIANCKNWKSCAMISHMIVHDLRTPLTSLLSGLQTIPFLADLETSQAECLDMAVSGGESLLAMINELLDISKMENGSLQLECKPINPVLLIERAIAQVANLAQEKNLTLKKEVSSNLPPLLADEEKLIRVLVNLCGNAIKFTPSGGTVMVGVKTGKAEIIFSVADTGEGIPPEYFERIFQKFGQVETRKSGKKMSTGLGLTFCKMVVEKHQGYIWVESETGNGSTFSFAVPAHR